jgi:hypothetical protein
MHAQGNKHKWKGARVTGTCPLSCSTANYNHHWLPLITHAPPPLTLSPVLLTSEYKATSMLVRERKKWYEVFANLLWLMNKTNTWQVSGQPSSLGLTVYFKMAPPMKLNFIGACTHSVSLFRLCNYFKTADARLLAETPEQKKDRLYGNASCTSHGTAGISQLRDWAWVSWLHGNSSIIPRPMPPPPIHH